MSATLKESLEYRLKRDILYFTTREIDTTREKKAVKAITITPNQHIDVDEDGRAVGTEFMMPDSIPQEAIQSLLRAKEKIVTLQ